MVIINRSQPTLIAPPNPRLVVIRDNCLSRQGGVAAGPLHHDNCVESCDVTGESCDVIRRLPCGSCCRQRPTQGADSRRLEAAPLLLSFPSKRGRRFASIAALARRVASGVDYSLINSFLLRLLWVTCIDFNYSRTNVFRASHGRSHSSADRSRFIRFAYERSKEYPVLALAAQYRCGLLHPYH